MDHSARRRDFLLAGVCAFASANVALATDRGATPAPDEIWRLMDQVTVVVDNERTGAFHLDQPPALRALAGRQVAMIGYVVWLSEHAANPNHFTLAREWHECPGCAATEPFAYVKVEGDRPLPMTGSPIVVSGRLAPPRDGEVAFRLTGANLVS